jgi:hypothetical protein
MILINDSGSEGPPLQSRSSLKLPTGQFLNGRPGSKPAQPYEKK